MANVTLSLSLILRLLSHSFGRKGQTNMKDIINNNEGIYFYESS